MNIAGRVRQIARRARPVLAVRFRQIARLRRHLPVMLDTAGFVAVTVGVARMWGDWAWLTAGVLLVLAGLRAQDDGSG